MPCRTRVLLLLFAHSFVPAPYTYTCTHATHTHTNSNIMSPFRSLFNLHPSPIFSCFLLFVSLAWCMYHCCDWMELNWIYVELGKKSSSSIVYRCRLFQAIQFPSKSVDELSAHEIQVNETDFIEFHTMIKKKE